MQLSYTRYFHAIHTRERVLREVSEENKNVSG